MRKLPLILLLVLSACGGNNPPSQPPAKPPSGVWDVSVAVTDQLGRRIPAATVELASMAKTANDFGWAYFMLQSGCYSLKVAKEQYTPSEQPVCIDRHTRIPVTLALIAPPTPRLQPNGRIFYQDGKPWRWKGVTAFGLMNRFCKGEDIDPFLQAYQGFNVLRVFYYVEWPGTGWGIPSDECVHQFLTGTAQRGWYVELVALTGPKPIGEAQALVNHLFATFEQYTNLLIELVNEPRIHDKVEPNDLTVPQTQIPWTDGLTVAGHRGHYLTPHTPRDDEWPRKAHDLLEYWTGGGPGSPSDPAFKQPAIADEPIRPDEAGYVASDFEAYFGVASILGDGATFHCETCKYGNAPTPDEVRCAEAALKALNFFPDDAALGPYSRIDEHGETLRTYKVGFNVVRVRPKSGPILEIQ